MDTYSLSLQFSDFTLLAVVLGALLTSVLVNYLLQIFSKTLGIRQASTRHLIRWNSQMKPSIGGFSFYVLFLICYVFCSLLLNLNVFESKLDLLGVFLSVSLGFLIGLIDDGFNTIPFFKFLGQMACSFLLLAFGIYIPICDFALVNYLFTMLWVIGIMNAINLIDNMDGIAGIVSLGIILGMIGCLIPVGNAADNFSLMVLLVAAGTLAGFLFFNWNPSRIFMGDTGSQFLGIFLSVFSILIIWQYRLPGEGKMFQLPQFFIPAMLFIIPLSDTTIVFISRIRRGQSPFVGGRDHISHHLAYLGLPDYGVALVLGGITLFSAVVSVLILPHIYSLKAFHYVIITGYLFTVFGTLLTLYVRAIDKRKALEQKREEAAATVRSEGLQKVSA